MLHINLLIMSKNVLCNYIYPRLRIHHCTVIRCISTQNHYANLKIKPNASVKEIKEAYINLTKEHHPDSNLNDNANHDQFLKISESYQILIDLKKRQEYDQSKGYSKKPPGKSSRSIFRISTEYLCKLSECIYRLPQGNNEDKRREALRRKHNFEQFQKSKYGLSDLVDIGLVLASLTAAYFLIIGILSSTVGKAQKEKHAKMAKYSKLYTDDIDQILEKGGKNWDEADKWIAREYIAKHYREGKNSKR
ncbi:unnamed protein product [Mytilus edulis]|uniref:J domain-containing protein n=1 Tax=Mytilus edulis TaxID=6550 RepID=A0A8S3TME2_MYTED|nr:unnamed protein product [Mytilus edulis]